MSRNKLLIIFLAILLAAFPCTTSMLLAQQSDASKTLPGEMLVHFTSAAAQSQFLAIINKQYPESQVGIQEVVSAKRHIVLLGFAPPYLDQIAESLSNSPGIQSFMPNTVITYRDLIPDDPGFDDQWHLTKIGAPDAWEVSTGGITPQGHPIVIAIMDSGFDALHPELKERMWINTAEIPDNGIDDDMNDFIDDVHGWDFNTQSDSFTVRAHGTGVIGLVGATGNNGQDGAGIDWGAQLLMMANPNGSVVNVVKGYYYLADLRQKFNETNGTEGAFIVVLNTSFGIDNGFCSEYPTWRDAIDTLGAAGILNVASTSNSNVDVDVSGDMPTSCTSPYLIAVTSTDQLDGYADRGYGETSIDLGAPGESMYSMTPNSGFDVIGSGTSFSCPLVSGTIALLYSLPCENLAAEALNMPATTALSVRDILLEHVEPVSELSGRTVTGGRLSIPNAVIAVQELCGAKEGVLAINNLRVDATGQAFFDVTVPLFEEYRYLVTDMSGRILFESTFEASRFALNEFSFSTRGWSTGVYALFIQGSAGYEAEKFWVIR